MRSAPSLATATLPWRAFRARPWAGGWVVASPQGELAVLDRELVTIATWREPRAAADLAVAASGALVVIAGDDGLRAHAVPGAAPAWSIPGAFLAVHPRGDALWSAAVAGDGIELAIRAVGTGAVRATCTVADPFGGSAVMMFAHPDPDRLVVWIAAGQDGQLAYLVTDRGGALDAVEVGPRDRLPPEFTGAGDAFLSAGSAALEHRAWPSGDLLATIRWPLDDDDDDDADDRPGSDVIALPGGYAAWSSTSGRLFLVDLAAAAVIDELEIAGQPELHYAVPRGDEVLTVHADTRLVVTAARAWTPP